MSNGPIILGLIVLLVGGCRAGELKRHAGILEIAPYTRGKDTRQVTVHTAGGERVVIDVHYDEKYLEYVNKRVFVVGGPPPPPEDERVQAAIYFHVSEIGLAPDEKPWDPPPKRVPAPPVVRSRSDIDALPGAWGMAVGEPTFTFDPPLVKKAEMYTLSRVQITLADGTKLSQAPNRMFHKTRVDEYKSVRQATILFETTRAGKIVTQKACLGHVPRCGVED